jgi:hypothetical protein
LTANTVRNRHPNTAAASISRGSNSRCFIAAA